MKLRLTVLLIFVAATTLAQQPAGRSRTPESSLQNNSTVASESASQILDENRNSIAVIVAAGNTSLKLGTGFFVRSTGLLLTNFHVVEGTDVVGVKIPGSDHVYLARKATGYDLDNDLLLLEVETSAAKPVVLGDSDRVKVGEPIVVVGNPEGLEETVSNGLLSGIRQLNGRNLFQISAPISEGSSGSPVFDGRGEVIGVVVSSLESGQNLNFAVPINYVKHLLSSTREEEIAALPKRRSGRAEAGNDQRQSPRVPDPAKLAVEAMGKVAGEIRACQGFSLFSPNRKKKPKFYYRTRWNPATDVRFDVKSSDSLVAPFEGIIEFSVHGGLSTCSRENDDSSCGPESPLLSTTTRHRYFYRVNGPSVELDYRTYFDRQSGKWVLQQGTPNMCWDQVGNH